MYPYSGLQLIDLLEKQHRSRQQSDWFKKGTFTLQWRAKVGSFPHPDLETLVSAGEPCGAWRPAAGRPEDKRNVGENWEDFQQLPLYGYIPAASIRGIVRSWAMQREDVRPKMLRLLGRQEGDKIYAGKIEFLDAYPQEATLLTLDIVNPQEQFQIYHEGQGTPLSLYTLGDGQGAIQVTIAIRGIPGQATVEEVAEVWQWVQQALSYHGIGSRTASGYGAMKAPSSFKPDADLRKSVPGYSTKHLEFKLYSQGNAGPNTATMEIRPSHWRGWLRSWLLRFFLGVMTPANAQITVAELMGTIDSPDDHASRKGVIRLQTVLGNTWSERSESQPHFYAWEGKLKITAPIEILNKVILPVIRIAVMVGGVGRGWRRPLHIFVMNNGRAASRGSYLRLTHQVTLKETSEKVTKPLGLATEPEEWTKLYQTWQETVQRQWSDRYAPPQQAYLRAEVFSPQTCAVYLVPGPSEEPIDRRDLEWITTEPLATRGQGMNLIYKTRYKRQPDVGGNAASGGNAHCSWASIKRVRTAINQTDVECQEIVCLFMGDQNQLRSQFLQELSRIPDSVHLFGLRPN